MTDGTNRPPEFSEQLETDPVHLSDQELLAQDYLIRRLWQFRGREEKVQWGGLSLEPEALLQRHDLLRQEMRKRSFLSVPSWEESDELEKIRAAFKSPGGKYHLFKKIIAVIPEHKTYVEAFCGGGQVYFHKASSEEEVINDIDPGIISSYRFIKAMTPEDLEWLKKQHWVISERQARNLFKMTPRTRRERFYRFLYLNKATYLGKGHIWTGIRRNGPNSEGNRIKIVDRLPEIQERLKRTKIHCWDWKEVIGQYDSPEAFFYLDPPYAIHWPKNETEGELEEKFFKEEEMI
ncbi:MAG: DNA adenine methylase, partial [Elusimicrobia bacterium]|nr:DNA adenine methylase [Elusimicrobiota bacterium]